jgi:hypothetical protein
MPNYFYTESVQRGRREHGDKWNPADLDAAAQFVPYFGTRQRIKVSRGYGDGEPHVRTGHVSRTTGWRPSFLLMHRSNSIGSSDLLCPEDQIIAVQNKHGRYVPVRQSPGDPAPTATSSAG